MLNNNYKPKSTQLNNDVSINYQNFTWKERELDQLYIQTYRHFTNKIR